MKKRGRLTYTGCDNPKFSTIGFNNHEHINSSLDIVHVESESTSGDEEVWSDLDSNSGGSGHEHDLEYDIPLVLRHGDGDYQELKKQKINDNSILNISMDKFQENHDEHVSDSDEEEHSRFSNNSVFHLDELQYSYFKQTGGIYLKETKPRLYAIKLGSIIVKEKVNGTFNNCQDYLVAKIGSTEKMDDERINTLMSGLNSLNLGPELIDTKIVFPKGNSLRQWENNWRKTLALKSFTMEDMMDLGVTDNLGPSEFILTSNEIYNTSTIRNHPDTNLYLFKGKTMWKKIMYSEDCFSCGDQISQDEIPCSICKDIVYNTCVTDCFSCQATICKSCSIICDCCENYFCVSCKCKRCKNTACDNTCCKKCSTKCDICNMSYCKYCVPKCEICNEFCCTEQCSNILPCDCGVICIECDIKKANYCHECETPICPKCLIDCNGCKTIGCKDCIVECSNCFERFCNDCGIGSCYICGKELCKYQCSENIHECHSCGNECCNDCTNNSTTGKSRQRYCSECKR